MKTSILADVELLDTIRRKQEELQDLISKLGRKVDVVQTDHIHQIDHIHQTVETSPVQPEIPAIPKSSPFYGRPRANEVYSLFNINARHRIGQILRKRGGAEIWQLMLAAIDAGLLTITKYTPDAGHLNLRVLFPAATFGTRSSLARIDLGIERDRIRVRDEILPTMIANRDRLISDPDCLEDIIREDQQARARARREAIEQDRYQEATSKLPKNEVAVIMFGQRLWPRLNENYGIYDYDQLCTAIWYFRTQDAVLFRSAPDPRSRAIEIRHSTKWFDDYVNRNAPDAFRSRMRRVFQLVHTMTKLLEESPAAECRPPPYKQIEG